MDTALSIKGQVSIPKPIREHLKLKPGDQVKFFVHPDGSVVILPKLPDSALRGIVASPLGRPASLDGMRKAVAAGESRGIKRGELL
jgi:AbrB family looped-hinge helix DNA binding protein